MITLRPVHRMFFLIGLLSTLCLISERGESFPVGDAFDKKQTDPVPRSGGYYYYEGNETQAPVNKSLQPNLTDQYNEPHPFPEYIKKFSQADRLPEYYRQLLLIQPEDHVQSKIFDMSAFKEMKRIGVLGFENKTYAPNISANAGEVVASQLFSELQSTTTYTVISPPEMNELMYRMKIVTTPSKDKKGKKETASPPVEAPDASKLPFTTKDMDGVLIGAVTKFMDTYKDERGELKKSISSGVEFGAYLISTKTGAVVWGARYVGAQPTGLISILKGETRSASWLEKEDLSRSAMKKVIQAFYENRGQKQDLIPLSENK